MDEAMLSRPAMTAVTLLFGDGEYTFNLTWGCVVEWEKTTGRSLFATFKAMLSGGDIPLECIRETIRLGLIGGGMAPVDALKKVKFYVEGRPFAESYGTALAIAGAALFGADKIEAAVAEG
ncbi:gene transfer agent family protein [Shinella fusca]|uniref:Gene transfer agent family protein n=1 Tax=Shinella fusca TaxID=544480 RepID=A0A7W8DVQ5_9HYPH|nr:gene transfer agent family protein [Shinella fusca]MBB5044028.1 hypothetical protein [Shinella fusca]